MPSASFASFCEANASEILICANAVLAIFCHSGCTICLVEVMISTWSPLLSV